MEATEVMGKLAEQYMRLLDRYKGRPFLNATMAAAAIIAIADDDACLMEGARVRQIMRTLDGLKVFDPEDGVRLFVNHVADIRHDETKGRAKAMEAIAAISGDQKAAALLIKICHDISEADGVVTASEKAEIDRLCDLVSIPVDVLEALSEEAKKL